MLNITPGYWAMLILSAVFAASGQILFKIGATNGQQWQDFLNIRIALGLLAYGISTALWIIALSKFPLKMVYPFVALTMALVYFGASVLLNEPITFRGILGTLIVLVGLGLIIMGDQ